MGFPIRTPPDQSLFASSPRLIAGYHVLHRLIVPRHPPYTLLCFKSILFDTLTSNWWSPSCDDVQLTFQLPMFSIFDECLIPSKIIWFTYILFLMVEVRKRYPWSPNWHSVIKYLVFKVRGRFRPCHGATRFHITTAMRIYWPVFPKNNWNGFDPRAVNIEKRCEELIDCHPDAPVGIFAHKYQFWANKKPLARYAIGTI